MGYDSDNGKLEMAARAAWLYFVAGKTQEEISRELRVSRPTAQRLVSSAVSQRLITFRFEHPIAACMELSERVKDRYGLRTCWVAPSDPSNPMSLDGVANAIAGIVETTLTAQAPAIVAFGTGRTLRAGVEQLQPISGQQHTLVALVGNIAPDGSASRFDVITRLAEISGARAFPIPLPVLAENAEQRDLLVSLPMVRRVHDLVGVADMTLVGIGQMDLDSQQFVDGFISHDELLQLIKSGAAGEIVGWGFDENGALLESKVNERVTSAPIHPDPENLVVGTASGPRKAPSMKAALAGRLVNGLITDENTARALLE
jgi:DNA-binding transcriptional regulator LsrR (DeoR family)